MYGFWLSTTVMVYVHESELSDGSVAVHVMSWLPISSVTVPESSHDTLADPLLSVADAGSSPTIALADEGDALIVRDAGQVTFGKSTSPIKIINEQLALLPDVSTVLQVTVVEPSENNVPEAFVQVVLMTATLSVAVGGAYVMTAVVWPWAGDTVWSAGHVMTGSSVSGTVTVKEQLDCKKALSTAVQATGVVTAPGKADPDGGLQLTARIPELSSAPTEKVTVAVDLPTSGLCTMLAGHEIAGSVVSVTDTSNVHEDCSPNAFVAVHSTVDVPSENVEGEAGMQTVVTVTPGESVALAVYVVVADGMFPVVCSTRFPGQAMTGGGLPLSTTLKEHDDCSPALSKAVHVTVLDPDVNDDPLAGVHDEFWIPEASDTLSDQLTTMGLESNGLMLMPRGHVMAGGVESKITTANGHDLWLPALSMAVHVTFVVPREKREPDDGLQPEYAMPELSDDVNVNVAVLVGELPVVGRRSGADTVNGGHTTVG